MIRKIKNHLLILITALTMSVPAVVPAVASAYSAAGCSGNVTNGIAQGANQSIDNSNSKQQVNCSSSDANGSNITSLAKTVVNLFSIIVGAVSIIMIIYGGFRYITSGGDSGRVGNAKNTLIYAIIGLVIVALAQIIVRYVLSQANNITT